MLPIALGGFIFLVFFAALTLWAASVISKREEERAEREYQKLLAEMHKERSKAG